MISLGWQFLRVQALMAGRVIAATTCWYFTLLGGPPPSSQINLTWRLILSYECLALACLVCMPAFLNLSIFGLGAFTFLYFSISFLFFLLRAWLCSWMTGLWSLPLSFLVSRSLFPRVLLIIILFSFWPHLFLSSASLLAVQLFIRPLGVLVRHSNIASHN